MSMSHVEFQRNKTHCKVLLNDFIVNLQKVILVQNNLTLANLIPKRNINLNKYLQRHCSYQF